MTRRKSDLLPHSEQCEKGLLSSFFYPLTEKAGEYAFNRCLFREVSDKWFYDEENGKLFNALMEMRRKNMILDLIHVTQYCVDHDKTIKFSHSDLPHWITSIMGFIGSATNIDFYIDQVQKKAAIRFAHVEALKLAESVKQCTELQEVSDCLTGAFTEAKELCRENEKKNWKKDEMMGFIEEIENIASGKAKPDVMPFFLPSLDEEVGGIKRGELCVVLGLSSTGKSLLGAKFITTNAVEHNRRSAIFTFEMPTRQYLKRTTASLGRISLGSMRDGKFTKQELNSFMDTQARIDKAPIEFFDIKRCLPTPKSIESAIRQHHKNHGLDMVLIDHLNLLRLSSGKSDARRDQELTSFADNMKILAQELDFAAIVLAQSNDKGSVFDSTQVESAADFSFALTPTYKTVNGVNKVDGTDGIWINKMREGRRGWKLPMIMDGKYASIEEGLPQPEPQKKSYFKK